MRGIARESSALIRPGPIPLGPDTGVRLWRAWRQSGDGFGRLERVRGIRSAPWPERHLGLRRRIAPRPAARDIGNFGDQVIDLSVAVPDWNCFRLLASSSARPWQSISTLRARAILADRRRQSTSGPTGRRPFLPPTAATTPVMTLQALVMPQEIRRGD